jgi:hypothetical protein
LLQLIGQILAEKNNKSTDPDLNNILIGRSLWSISAHSESLTSSDPICKHLKASLMDQALEALKDQN